MATVALALLGVANVATVNGDTNPTKNTLALRGVQGDLTNAYVVATTNLQTQGEMQGQPSVQSGNFTLGGATDYFCNASGGNITVGLPAASSKSGTPYFVYKSDSGNDTVSIPGVLGGNSTITLQGDSRRIVSDGSNWYCK